MMFCHKIVKARRYYLNAPLADGRTAIDVVFLAIETSERELIAELAKREVFSQDFEYFIEAAKKDQLDACQLLVSTDGKYASFFSRDADKDNEADNIGLFGGEFRTFMGEVEGNTVDEILANFQSVLLNDPDLFQIPGISAPELRINNRIDYARIDFPAMDAIGGFPNIGNRALEDVTDDRLAIALFAVGAQNRFFGSPDHEISKLPELMEELWRRIDLNDWVSGEYMDFRGITPREIVARRIRAENALAEVNSIAHDFNYGDGELRARRKISNLKGDLLAETATLAFLTMSPFVKLFIMAVDAKGRRARGEDVPDWLEH
jgi:hypothetical protein